MRERPPERAFIDTAPRRSGAVYVVAFATALRDEVAQDVRRPGVEGRHAVGFCFRDQREVRDAAEVQESDRRALSEEHEVRERHERRALSAGRDVRAPEVRDRRHAGPKRDPRRVAELECRALRQVRHGLPVHRDDLGESRERRYELARGVGVRVADGYVQLGELRGADRLTGGRGEDSLSQRLVVIVMPCR